MPESICSDKENSKEAMFWEGRSSKGGSFPPEEEKGGGVRKRAGKICLEGGNVRQLTWERTFQGLGKGENSTLLLGEGKTLR